MEYSVINKPVIAVIRHGKQEEVSLRELIAGAHELEDMGGSAIESYAQLRFAAAFVMDMLEMTTSRDRRRAFEAGRFDEQVIDRYVEACRAEGSVFDLFDGERPFMQSAFTEERRQKTEKPASIMDLTVPSGNDATFLGEGGGVLGYSVSEKYEMTIPKAFRVMLARQCFSGYSLEGPWAINRMPYYLYPKGSNLFETILLNTLSEEEALPLEYGRGRVPWRNGRAVIGEKGKTETDVTLLEALTWQPRKIQMLPSEDGIIRRVCLTRGLDFAGEYVDPYVIRIRNVRTDTVMSLKPDVQQAGWLIIANVVADTEETSIVRPDFLHSFMNVYSDRPKNVTLNIIGVDRDPKLSKFYGWVRDEMIIPESLLENNEQAETLLLDLRFMANCERNIALMVRGCVDDPKAFENHQKKGKWAFDRRKKPIVSDEVTAYFTKQCEGIVEDLCMSDMLGGMSWEEHTERVCEAVKDVVKSTMTYMYGMLGSSEKEMEKGRRAEQEIWHRCGYQIKERKGEITNGDETGKVEPEESDNE